MLMVKILYGWNVIVLILYGFELIIDIGDYVLIIVLLNCNV